MSEFLVPRRRTSPRTTKIAGAAIALVQNLGSRLMAGLPNDAVHAAELGGLGGYLALSNDTARKFIKMALPLPKPMQHIADNVR